MQRNLEDLRGKRVIKQQPCVEESELAEMVRGAKGINAPSFKLRHGRCVVVLIELVNVVLLPAFSPYLRWASFVIKINTLTIVRSLKER